jgi:hypothetical protein
MTNLDVMLRKALDKISSMTTQDLEVLCIKHGYAPVRKHSYNEFNLSFSNLCEDEQKLGYASLKVLTDNEYSRGSFYVGKACNDANYNMALAA